MRQKKNKTTKWKALAVVLFAILQMTFAAAPALAGRASSGKLFFYPCKACHPIGTKPIPNNFKGHQIKLESHDKLGKGTAACLVCHDSPTRNPGLLKLIDGSLVSITGDVSKVCYRCHSTKYKAWKAGAHGRIPLELDGKYGENTKCTTKGCHNPHTPGWISVQPLPPFLGVGIEAHLLPQRVSFTALPVPPDPPVSPSFLSLKILAVVTLIAVAGLITVPAIKGKEKR